ncbi:MAG: hypothetical protein MJE77_01720 [Proteobacteria bacterium]|nr:hypothetical protein [Pseudomonadota bacterium]
MRCLLSRWAISRTADDGGSLSGRTRRHVESCADCRRFQHRVETLGAQLSSGRAAAPAALLQPDDRVIRPESGDRQGQPANRGRRAVFAASVAALAMTAALIFYNTNPYANDDSPVKTRPARAKNPEQKTHIPGDPGGPGLALAVDTLANDAEQGLRYVLRVSGLPGRSR